MSSSSFDLDIQNYSFNELLNMFSLNKPYEEEEVTRQKLRLKDRINSQLEMPINKKNNICDFLDRASNKIISAIQSGPVVHKPQNFLDLKNKLYPSAGSTYLIKSSFDTEGLNAKAWEGKLIDSPNHPPGFINPINISTIKRTVNIDTRFRSNYYNTSATNFSLTLPTKLSNVLSMRLASIEIPISYYVVAQYQGNSFFKIDWDYNVNYVEEQDKYSCTGVVKIPDGNYEPFWEDATLATDLASTVNTFMHSLSTTGTKLDPDGDLDKIKNIYYNVERTSGRSGFAWDASSLVQAEPFRITFGVNEEGLQDVGTNLQLRLGWFLGFRVSVYEGDSIVSEGICYMKGPRYAFLCINDYNNSVSDYFISAFSSSILQKDIIARINLTSIQQTNGVYQSGQDDGSSIQINRQRNYFGPVDVERLEIKLIDEFGRIIDLNNMDWSMALTMECYYSN
jgi:hypothetical protein